MGRAETKAERLRELEVILLAHPEGMTQAQLARVLSVHRSTISRNLAGYVGPIFEEDDGRLRIDRQAYLVNVRFNLHEALALHLAARLLASRMDRQNPHAASALRKLGLALEYLAPCISQHVQRSANQMDQEHKLLDANYLRTMETLALVWAEGRKVNIWYRKSCGEPVKQHTLSPYYIEPNAVGQSTYVIGNREPGDFLITLKIERIERVELLRERYTIPADFAPNELFSDAWGVWYTNAEPVQVVLKFSTRVAQRIGETRWHRSEQVTVQPDGSLLWCAWVAEPQEMMPWVRGWGADVEVIVPANMRQQIQEEVKKLNQIYGG
jgi:predicted DNA-binding transcriptional regulator YafY